MRIMLNVAVALGVAFAASAATAQGPGSTSPVEGLRDYQPTVVALEHLKIVVRPGEVIEDGTILICDGQVLAIGDDVAIPAGAERIDHQGRVAYAGFIDAYSETEVPDPSRDVGAPHWNGNIMPQRQASQHAAAVADAGKLRSQGITLRVVAPEGGIVKGSSCMILCGDGESRQLLLGETGWQHLSLTVPRRRGGGASRDGYPNSPMGATALLRQALLDANWYRDANRAFEGNQRLPKPEKDAALETLAKALESSVFVIDAPNERMAKRAADLAKEFQLQVVLKGSGREYRQLDEAVAQGHPLLIPVDFPDAPKISRAVAARETTLQELLNWEFAPSNPAQLAKAGLTICLTTEGLSDVGLFLKQVRKAVEAGLDADAALAALTTAPAKLLGVDDLVGTIEPSRMANLVIMSGDLFAEKSETVETWVAGKRYEVAEQESSVPKKLAGKWSVAYEPTAEGESTIALVLTFKEKGKGVEGTLALAVAPADEANAEEQPEEAEEEGAEEGSEKKTEKKKEPKAAELSSLEVHRDHVTAVVELDKVDATLPAGKGWFTLLFMSGEEETEIVSGSLRLPSGQQVALAVSKVEETADEADTAEADTAKEESEKKDEDKASEESQESEKTEEGPGIAEQIAIVHPLGAYGLSEAPEQAACVMFRGATVWTSGPEGIIEGGDVLVESGKIVAVGNELDLPEGCQVIDLTGKHLTPGLIDCHSHMATDGGVNESGQTITCEVRIADFIDNSDISIYRQLAGGLTCANILHGSANPIGGQNQVIKLRWGATMDEMRFAGAPAGVKFALGENVKRRAGRYPNTRMGVEQIIRDQLLAAREYAAAHKRYQQGDRSSLPPRIDLQMEALAEIIAGERWIHCHSYRQDEIVALLDVLDEFGIQIGSLQHILEGYKVADRMLAHGATASSFSDWWAYKFEVFDAIPHNGALMHDIGIVVSFNSDDAELARHMNTEAAKAVKYGGVAPEEALKFVTLNPAKQLRIDSRVGSIEVGKDADFAVWSRSPLSTMTRCEQTWVDGRCYFSLEKDAELRKRDAEWHAALVQKAIGGSKYATGARQPRMEEEERWHRHDIYCGHHGHEDDELIHQQEHGHEHEAAMEAHQ